MGAWVQLQTNSAIGSSTIAVSVGTLEATRLMNQPGALVLDVREGAEFASGHLPRARHIPLGQLRARLAELPRDREIHVICRSGQRAYIATRMLLQNGFNAKTVSGGMLSLAHNYLMGQEDLA